MRQITVLVISVVLFLMTVSFTGPLDVKAIRPLVGFDENEIIENDRDIALEGDYFIKNDGQVSDLDHRFYSSNGEVHFLNGRVLMRFCESEPLFDVKKDWETGLTEEPEPNLYQDRGVVLEYSFIGSNPVEPIGRERCGWSTNYFYGSDPNGWFTNIPGFREVVYENVWDGIDFVYRSIDGKIKYDIVLSPGADPTLIRIHVDGNNGLKVDEKGDIIITTDFHDIIDSGLTAGYGDGWKGSIDIAFKVAGDHEFCFTLGQYDRCREVVIDPLTYSTFIGTTEEDHGWEVFVDDSGYAYIAGDASNQNVDFPTTPGAFDRTRNGYTDMFLTKFDKNGTALVFSTYLGSNAQDERCRGLFVDSIGNAYLTGFVGGSTNFPTTAGAFGTTHNGNYDAFITKFNSTGSALIYSTLIGGSLSEFAYDIDVDENGNAYIVGNTEGGSPAYPTTSGAYDTTHNGAYGAVFDVFVTKLNQTGSSLVYSTFVGGDAYDYGNGIDVDANGYAYITGKTNDIQIPSASNYPVTSGAYDRTHNGGNDVFVTKLDQTGSSLNYSTFIGGNNDDYGNEICIDNDGNAYLIGDTINGNFPTTTGAYDTSHNNNWDVFVTKLNSNGTGLLYSTFIGGWEHDHGNDIFVNSKGMAYITGNTEVSYPRFPTTNNAFDTTFNGGWTDVFVSLFSSSGSSLLYSTFIGGAGDESGEDIFIDSDGDAYIVGSTGDGITDYPVTSGAYDTSHNGGGWWDPADVFLTKFYIPYDKTPPEFNLDRTPINATTGDTFTFNVSISDETNVSAAYVEYWFGTGSHTNDSMAGNSGNFTLDIKIPWNSTDTLQYILHAVDPQDLWNQTAQKNVTVLDNDLPIFGEDGSDTSGTTGDMFNLTIQVTDNIGVFQVNISYHFGDGPIQASTLQGINNYSIELVLPWNSTDPLVYCFNATDKALNWNITKERTIPIQDNDRPMFGHDGSDLNGTTGDEFDLSIEVEDNIKVHTVSVEYWFGSGPHFNETMEGIGPYDFQIILPLNSTESLNYLFHSNDTSGSWNSTISKQSEITDNDLPVFLYDLTPEIATTGDEFTFEMMVIDNIYLYEVWVTYWFGEGPQQNTKIEETDGYNLSIVIPAGSLDPLHYTFGARDTALRWNWTQTKTVEVEDNDQPNIGPDLSQSSGTTGDEFIFLVNVKDNIDVSKVYLEYWFGSGPVTNMTMETSDEGYVYVIEIPADSLDPLHYTVRAIDGSGNWANTSQIVIGIVDNDRPIVLADNTPDNATTGSNVTIWMEFEDNIGVNNATMEYWFGSGSRGEISIMLTEIKVIVTIPRNSLDPLHYIATLTDEAGNVFKTTVKNVTVRDIEPPELKEDLTNSTAFVGRPVEIKVRVSDNIDIEGVKVHFWTEGPEDPDQVTMDMDTVDGFYIFMVMIREDSSEDLSYYLIIEDTSGNRFNTSVKTVEIIDDIFPIIENIADLVFYIGDELYLDVKVSDNIGISSIIWYGGPFSAQGNIYEGTVNTADIYEMNITATDMEGNIATMDFTLTVLPLDNDKDGDGIPDLVEREMDLDEDDPADANADPDTDGLNNLEEYLNGTGHLEPDSDDDGMPDGWEVDNRLFPTSPSADRDTDGDGRKDLLEYQEGTDPNVPDGDDETSDPPGYIFPLIGILLLVLIVIGILVILTTRKKGKEEE